MSAVESEAPVESLSVPLVDVVQAASTHRVTSFDGAELAVLEWPGDQNSILLAHATGFHKELWAPVVIALRARGVSATLLAADMRGHGDSDQPSELSWWDYGRDVTAIMRALSGDGVAVGVGHSLGGGAVLGAELLSPGTFAGIVLADPAAMSGDFLRLQDQRFGNPWAEGARRRRDRYPSKEAALENFSSKQVFAAWTDGLVALYSEFGLDDSSGEAILKCSPEWEAMTFSCSDMTELWPRLPEVGCPITLITGQESVTHAADHARESALHMRARHVRLPGIGHFIPMEAPEWVATEVARALVGVSR